jgi:hypothetical protein
MEKADQDARQAMLSALDDKGISLGEPSSTTDPADAQAAIEIIEKLAAVDEGHRARLRQIIAVHGWPGRTLVGVDGAHAAWLIVQHADADRKFQKECLALMESAALGDVTATDIAYLTDRVLVGETKPQKYGTQLDGNYQPFPIDDAEHVDERRAAVGLGPLAEYIKSTKAAYEAMSRGSFPSFQASPPGASP